MDIDAAAARYVSQEEYLVTAFMGLVGRNPVAFWLPVNAHLIIATDLRLLLVKTGDVLPLRFKAVARDIRRDNVVTIEFKPGFAFSKLTISVRPAEIIRVQVPRQWNRRAEMLSDSSHNAPPTCGSPP